MPSLPTFNLQRRRLVAWARLAALAVLLWAVAMAGSATGQQTDAEPPASFVQAAHAEMAASLAQNGALPVIVDLHVPGVVAAAGSDAEAAAVAEVQTLLVSSLAAEAISNVKHYSHLPALALTVESPAALEALIANPLVAGVYRDEVAFAALEQSVPTIGASLTRILGHEGMGTSIAILDSGTDRTHSLLSGKVISEGCFSTTNAALSATSLCPGGASQSLAQNSGLHCTVTGANCFHGTHVASIAAAVAPKATLVAMQVFSRMVDTETIKTCANAGRTSPCILTFTSDQLQALNRVYVLKTQVNPINLVAVNMSLGSGKHSGPCVTSVPVAYSSIISSLRTAGVATITSAGNSGHLDAMGSPGCLSNVISVGATTDANQIASFSNLSSMTTLLAPGEGINAAMPGNSMAALDGTSMAAPHVAGAIAVLRSAQPAYTVNQLQSVLVSTGALVPDQRTGAPNDNKRRINLYAALCAVITCDNDDFRTLQPGVTTNGTIASSSDRDPYYHYLLAGNTVSISMARQGSLDPFLALYTPNGVLVASNDNGGGGADALIANYTVQQTGLHTVLARSSTLGTGSYSVVTAVQPTLSNAVPSISWLSPAAATANSSAGSFWVAIHGSNFVPTSQVHWNGVTRIVYYSSSTLIYIWVRGSDIGPTPFTPRQAYINVSNPSPGGGASNYLPFTINNPTLGESKLVQPALESSVETGIKQTFVLSWTVPVTEVTWRIMQNMDLRLRDETGRVAASVRVVERPGPDSVYQVLNGAGEPLLDDNGIAMEGIPGVAQDLVISDTLTLHLDESAFVGSGRTAIMSPTITFGPNAVGRWRVEFRVDKTIDEMGSFVQDEDILGTVTIVDPACALPVDSVEITGPEQVQVGMNMLYSLAVAPPGASQPITITWAPEPASGQGTAAATYRWMEAGRQTVFAAVENCNRFAANIKEVATWTTASPDLDMRADAPSVVAAGSPVTYTLVVSNSGQMTATHLLLVAFLPAGTSHVAGGTLQGSEVTWSVADLAGLGASHAVTMTVMPVATQEAVLLSAYRVQADGAINVAGTRAAETEIADAVATLQPLQGARLTYPASATYPLTVAIPAGALADPGLVAVTEALTFPGSLPPASVYGGRTFRVAVHQANRPQEPLTLTESISITLAYPTNFTASQSAHAAGQSPSPTLYYWTGAEWSSAGISCQTQAAGGTLQCNLERAKVGAYALFLREASGGPKILLPMIQKGTSP